MRVLVIADMEGVSGVETVEATTRGHPAYAEGVQLFAAEVNTLAEAAFEAGASHVSVIDWHGGGGNLRPELLSPRLELAPEDLTRSYDVAILSGFHAMAGTDGAFLSHTMTGGLELVFEGRPAGELALLSRWAGEHAIPVALVTGDRATSLEAEVWLDQTPTLTVKQAVAWDRAAALPVEQAHRALREAVTRALRRPDRWWVYRPTRPVDARVRLRCATELATRVPGVSLADGWLVVRLPSVKGLIDLLDVFAALMRVEEQRELLEAIASDPAARLVLERERARQREQFRRLESWPVV
jgi:D-amino peptidase